ncbi:hydantoinase/oxoprolinase family protein [Methanolapillus millepedarum]|uniref:Hydantoinase/oxoprolinase family protein n=1 Tax=Methanolapillus millepedarum TaxID=3028296 RepID=A0AA96V484_9EURY|nr:hypothetical protein MsAc7_07610 [Methanosarcinaceae archaeon Ac7]
MEKSLSLGIDAGGTYTDAAIVDLDSRHVLESDKALTTYPDPIGGISSVLDKLNPDHLKQVKLLSVSTTFATNTILEKNGATVALILIGTQKIPEHLKDNCVVVTGGHNYRGKENEELDMAAIEEYVLKMKECVSAFAVSAFYSILNPEHELRAKKKIMELTGYPVVCGHELAHALGAYERGITAYLNASLLPIAKNFLDAILAETKNRGMDVKTTMLKCNGAVALFSEVMEKPVETIFSGPAASVLGAAFLSGKDTCIAIDVGGTSTDVSMIVDQIPKISDLGATVGGWRTKVRAIQMETTAMGGDSHIWFGADSVQDARFGNIKIGPRRVIPLCRAVEMFPGLSDTMKNHWVSHNQLLNEFVQPTTLVMKSKYLPVNLSAEEMKTYNKIGDLPRFLGDLAWESDYIPFDMIENLVNKRLVQVIGLTPTDILHVTGDYIEWDKEASVFGAKIMADLLNTTKEDLCQNLKKKFARTMARELVYFMDDTFSREELDAFLDKDAQKNQYEKTDTNDSGKKFLRFKIDIPVVLIGAPVRCFIRELSECIDAEIIAPEHYAVGNAVGCLAGKLAKRVEIQIEVQAKEDESGYKEKSFVFHTTDGEKTFSVKQDAIYYAETYSKNDIFKYMKENQIQEKDVEFKTKIKELISDPKRPPVQINVIVEGFAENKI